MFIKKLVIEYTFLDEGTKSKFKEKINLEDIEANSSISSMFYNYLVVDRKIIALYTQEEKND